MQYNLVNVTQTYFIMQLVFDEYYNYFSWVVKDDHDTELSPQFDTKAEADAWLALVTKLITQKAK